MARISLSASRSSPMADKAFLSGINDYRTISDLRGCVNDTESITKLLKGEFGFKKSQICVKKDEEVTKAAMNEGWEWLLEDAEPGDRLIFHFSGHGSYIADTDQEEGEADSRDELLCLYGMDWNDKDTYLLDDELAAWTKQIPTGVQVTFVLDCCHSGTGTRFIQPPMSRAARGDFLTAGGQSLDDIATRRFRGSRSGSEKAVKKPEGIRPEASDQVDQNTVLARFAPPPAAIQAVIGDQTKTRTIEDALQSQARSRSGRKSTMNHVLWSGCKDNQTSADAYINGDYHGAFTYYFCESVRDAGGEPQSKAVIKSLRSKLRDENFTQIPQLEPAGTSGLVFGASSNSNSGNSTDDGDDIENEGCVAAPITPGDWNQLLTVLQQIADQLAGGNVGRSDGRGESDRSLVYVHGICEHHEGYSDSWWNAMSPHLSLTTRNALSGNRHEVLWSEHVSKMNRSLDDEFDPDELRQMELMLEAVLEERVAREASEQISENRSARSGEPGEPASRAFMGIPGVDCVDDFVKYLSSDTIRRRVIAEATDVIRPLLEAGGSVELISHSWGTVVAFEALRKLERENLPGRVHNWFTVGAALAINFVAKRLEPSDGRKPRMVDRWINLDAKGDPVGGSVLSTGLRADHEFLRLKPEGCKPRFGFVKPACAHSSYFDPNNDRVNRDIFAKWIQEN